MNRWAFLLIAALSIPFLARSEEPRLTISQIMLKAHQPERAARKALDQRVIDGKASDAEKKQLLQLYESLVKAVPNKGSQDDWNQRTSAIAEAARGVIKGEEKGAEKLAAAINCKACHVLHRKGL